MAQPVSVDVLVIGSGASGLAAAVSAERSGARVALAAKGALQSCNSAKAQGGIQAAFGDDDSPEQHAEDVWKSSHETADRKLVEILTCEAPSAIHWLEELGVEFTRENGGYRLARCGGSSRKRLLQVGDRTGHAITTALREAVEGSDIRTFPKSPLAELARTENGWRARCGDHAIDAMTVVLAAGGRCYRVAQERGELSTNHPGATGEVTQMAADLGAELRDFDALQYHPNGGAWPTNMQGYSIPETTRAYGAVRARCLGNRVPLHVGRPRAAVRMVLERVEVAQLRAEVSGHLRHFPGRPGMVRRQLTAFLSDAIAPPARREDHRHGVDRVIPAARTPAVLGPRELGER